MLNCRFNPLPISGGLSGGWLYSTLSWILNILRDSATSAWLAYFSGLLSQLGYTGFAIAAIINTFLISFTVTDILVNSDGTLTQKGCVILTYVATQFSEIILGVLTKNYPAVFLIQLYMVSLYVELLKTVIIDKKCGISY